MDSKYEFIGFQSQYSSDFARLNYEWIEAYFQIEETDRNYLDNPEKMIIEKGGEIIFIRKGNEIIGTCALVRINNDLYELAKMAIDPKEHGNGLGYRLGKAIIDKARQLGAKKLFLESNTILKPAINLYRKLGFKEIEESESPYARSNIQMEYYFD